MIVGYCRVSTDDQSLDIQIAALKEAGCERLFEEKVSGANVTDRLQLKAALDFVREGDTFVVTKIDRLARSVVDLMGINELLEKKAVALRILNMGLDTKTPTGKLMLGVLGSVAEFERNMIRERQKEGIAAAKAKGVYTGGKQQIDRNAVWRLLDAGTSKAAIARELDCAEMTIYRVIKEGRPGLGDEGAALL